MKTSTLKELGLTAILTLIALITLLLAAGRPGEYVVPEMPALKPAGQN